MGRVSISPAEFTLVPYDAAEIAAIVEDAAALTGFPAGTEIRVDVDEELFPPLVGYAADVVDGRAVLWISGGNLEDPKRPRVFSPERARADFVLLLLRAGDRLTDAFAGAPPDAELTLAEKQAWETWACGRSARLGVDVKRQRRLYDFRLQHGFTDAADAVFERLWNAQRVTWDGIREACKETGAADRAPSKVRPDLLRNPR